MPYVSFYSDCSRVVSFVILYHHGVTSHVSVVGLYLLLINKVLGQLTFNPRLHEDGCLLGYKSVYYLADNRVLVRRRRPSLCWSPQILSEVII